MSEELTNFSKCHQYSQHNWKFISNENANEVLDPLDKAVFKYKNLPSILTIKNSLGATIPFLFNEVSLSDIEEELSNLNTKKSSTFKNVPAKILKISRSSCWEILKALYNKAVLTGNFPREPVKIKKLQAC